MSYSDEQLVLRAKNGDHKAFNVLFKRYEQQVVHFIYLSTHDKALAHDLTQEVLLKVYCCLVDFKQQSLFSTWLYRIIRNTLTNYFRLLGRRARLEMQYVQDYSYPMDASPEQSLIHDELSKQFERVFSTLTKELSDCYGMLLFDGCTYEDIAKKMHCPIGTVRSRIYRARKLVTQLIG